MKMLHPNLAPLADIAAKEPMRYDCDRVHVRGDDKTYIAYATDQLIALEVEGELGVDQPIGPEFDAAPETASAGSVPAKVWKSTFSAAKLALEKVTARGLRYVGFKVGLGKWYLYYSTMPGMASAEGVGPQPPPLAKLLPKTPVVATFRFDPVKLSTLLDVIAKIAPGEFVELTIHRDSPIAKLTAQTLEQKLTGAICGAAK